MRLSTDKFFFLSLFIFSLLFLSATTHPFVLVLSQDDLTDPAPSAADDDGVSSSTSDWNEFGDSDTKREEELDPGSWRPIFEPDSELADPATDDEAMYYSGVTKMVTAVSSGDPRLMEEAAVEIEAAAAGGYPHAQSVLGFLYKICEKSKSDDADMVRITQEGQWLAEVVNPAHITQVLGTKLEGWMTNR